MYLTFFYVLKVLKRYSVNGYYLFAALAFFANSNNE